MAHETTVEGVTGAASAYIAVSQSCLSCAVGLLEELACTLDERAAATGVRALAAQLRGAMRLIESGHGDAS